MALLQRYQTKQSQVHTLCVSGQPNADWNGSGRPVAIHSDGTVYPHRVDIPLVLPPVVRASFFVAMPYQVGGPGNNRSFTLAVGTPSGANVNSPDTTNSVVLTRATTDTMYAGTGWPPPFSIGSAKQSMFKMSDNAGAPDNNTNFGECGMGFLDVTPFFNFGLTWPLTLGLPVCSFFLLGSATGVAITEGFVLEFNTSLASEQLFAHVPYI